MELTHKSGMDSGLGCAAQTVFPSFPGSSVPHRSLSGGDANKRINEAFKYMQVFPLISSGPARESLFFSVIRAFLSKSTMRFSAPKVTFLPITIPAGHGQAVLSLNPPGLTHRDPLSSSPPTLKIITRQPSLSLPLLSPASPDHIKALAPGADCGADP